ncbi:hypothetical protein DUI87_27677 [Hirundo rustica rustica]|uniref:Uncharacterized protein n=1 Tax=Hirundo rustica rustica TaxID=333673 RepID=A0A3M0J3B9_HIRRU|nr:hypothetical protein DUI87_27677 [Hirundo rustica rustica]
MFFSHEVGEALAQAVQSGCDTPSMGTFKAMLDGTLSNLDWWEVDQAARDTEEEREVDTVLDMDEMMDINVDDAEEEMEVDIPEYVEEMEVDLPEEDKAMEVDEKDEEEPIFLR